MTGWITKQPRTEKTVKPAYKQIDITRIAAYLRTRSDETIPLDDIIRDSGAEKLCISPSCSRWSEGISSK